MNNFLFIQPESACTTSKDINEASVISRLDHFPGNNRINALIGRTEVGDCWTRAVAPALNTLYLYD